MKSDKKLPKPLALDAVFPCQKSCRAEQSFADKLIDRAVDHQSKQALSIVIEHASDNFCQALSDAVAEQIVDLIERPAQQAEERLV